MISVTRDPDIIFLQRMHKGVLRDIQKEEDEARQQLALSASSLPTDPSQRVCEGDICDLSQTRFRDPVTGKVYVPEISNPATASVS